jgi:hypothetical protein
VEAGEAAMGSALKEAIQGDDEQESIVEEAVWICRKSQQIAASSCVRPFMGAN